MTARQQLARLLPLVLLIVLAMAGLRGDGAAVGLILEVVLGVLLVITRRRDRAARRTAPAGPAESDGRQDVPGTLRFALTWVLGVGMAAVAVVLLANLHLHLFNSNSRPPVNRQLQPFPRPTVRRVQAMHGGPLHIPIGPILYGLLIAALVAAVVISIWWAARLRRPAVPGELPADLAEDSAGLRDAVQSGRAALAELDDARAAIIACYLAMERSLADRGTARAVADTPGELLARALGTGMVRGPAARRLTALFYEARFSTHPLGPQQREAARRALDDLAAELREDAVSPA